MRALRGGGAIALLALSALLFPVQANAQHRPLVYVAGAAMTADCVTTSIALRDPTAYETNPLLPRRPSAAHLAAACVVAMAATVGVAELLPRKARPWLYGAVALLGVTMAVRNITL